MINAYNAFCSYCIGALAFTAFQLVAGIDPIITITTLCGSVLSFAFVVGGINFVRMIFK